MSRPSPEVSILLVTYNRLPFLRVAIDSVMAQTFHDWELLIIDDGSTDGTPEWIAGIVDDRVRFLKQPHLGKLPQLRNIGVAASAGEWIAFLDDDDAWLPEKLQRQMELHRQHPEWLWSYTAVQRIDQNGNPLPSYPNKQWRPQSGQIILPLLNMDIIVASPSVVMRKDLILEVGGFDEALEYSIDYDLWFRAAKRAAAGVVDEPLTIVREHPGNRTAFQPSVNISFIRSYAKFSLQASPEERRVCMRRQAYHRVRLARQWLSTGEHRKAFRALGEALIARPTYPWAWRTLGKAIFNFLR